MSAQKFFVTVHCQEQFAHRILRVPPPGDGEHLPFVRAVLALLRQAVRVELPPGDWFKIRADRRRRTLLLRRFRLRSRQEHTSGQGLSLNVTIRCAEAAAADVA